MIQNVNRETLSDQAYSIIKNRIINGEYLGEQRLTEQGVAKSMNLSPTPVREAFNRLVTEGFLVSRPYKGVFVRKYEYKDVKQAYMARAKLQALITQFLIERITESKLEELEIEYKKSQEESYDNFFYKYYEFQYKIFLLSESEILLSSITPLNAIINVQRLLLINDEPDKEKIDNYYSQLMDSIRKKDVDLAVEITELMVINIMGFVLDNFDSFMN